MSDSGSPPPARHAEITEPAQEDEPDDRWKEQAKQTIEARFTGMIKEAKKALETNLQRVTAGGAAGEEEKARLKQQFFEATNAIKRMAKEELNNAVGRERSVRRLARGGHVDSHRADLAAPEQPSRTFEQDISYNDLLSSLSDDGQPEPAEPESPEDPLSTDIPEGTASTEDGEEEEAKSNEGEEKGALAIQITRLPIHPPVDGTAGWVTASDAARRYELAIRKKNEIGLIAPPPPPPVKRWVSASDVARQSKERARWKAIQGA
ncbi:hypothetical protein C8J57DRAFT_1498448 [Mycena rebaudengoi]|nr:hypothetical protein C8J57DRAFT_1498448 [Mycena rebaudengoi]